MSTQREHVNYTQKDTGPNHPGLSSCEARRTTTSPHRPIFIQLFIKLNNFLSTDVNESNMKCFYISLCYRTQSHTDVTEEAVVQSLSLVLQGKRSKTRRSTKQQDTSNQIYSPGSVFFCVENKLLGSIKK